MAPTRTDGAQSPPDESGIPDRITRTQFLFERVRAGGADVAAAARDEIVMLHLDVAESIARRYRNRGVSHEDLVQVACLGLVKATRGFDAERSDNFLAYAVPTMLGEVKRFFRDHAWVVRPPRRVQELQAEIATARAAWQQQEGRLPTATDLALDTGAGPHEIREAMQADNCYAPTSLDRITTDDGSTLADLLGAHEVGFDHAENVSTLRPLCEQLPDRDRRILYLRFFREWTQARIAEELDVTQMQVSRLLRRILRDLRAQIELGDGGTPTPAPPA